MVGTITTFDPYPPPTLGMAVQVFSRGSRPGGQSLDTHALTRALSDDTVARGSLGGAYATAQAAGVFDASNHRTLRWLDDYANGRADPEGTFGTDIYLVSMDWYTKFVCHRLLRHLLAQEHFRLSPPVAQKES